MKMRSLPYANAPSLSTHASIRVLARPSHAAWKMMMAPVADSMQEAAAATDPAAVAGLDPVSPNEIGTSATDFSKDADA